MLNEGRPTAPAADTGNKPVETFTANRGLQIEEPLLFEIGRADVTGVDLPEDPQAARSAAGATGRKGRLGAHARKLPIDLPGLSAPETMRHYVRLSQKNYAIDSGIYPLGSCTMKHNPRLNEKMARLAGFGDIHPLQPLSTVTGAVELIDELCRWLLEMTGMAAVAFTPKAGAHGELTGMMAIKAALTARGEARKTVLVPHSAHGTNPATAALLGYRVVEVPARGDGIVDPAEVRSRLNGDVAAIMLTNPNTCGLFERDVVAIADAVHASGAYFYADGANFNAIVGKPFAPLPIVAVEKSGGTSMLTFAENEAELAGTGKHPLGRMSAFHGQMGMFVRAMSYMLSHGADGMRQASEDAVLNANYIRAGLSDLMTQPFGDKPCMHEALFDDRFLEGTGVTTLDFAKAMIDEGFHPMTMYFPLVVHGALLIEPTESESKASLDLFVATLRDLVMRAKHGEVERFRQAPQLAPRRRLDETRAARSPKLRWEKPQPWSEAAE